MTLRELHVQIEKLLEKYGDLNVYADIVTSPNEDPMPPIRIVYEYDGYICIGD